LKNADAERRLRVGGGLEYAPQPWGSLPVIDIDAV
jgi:hypothetical protein